MKKLRYLTALLCIVLAAMMLSGCGKTSSQVEAEKQAEIKAANIEDVAAYTQKYFADTMKNSTYETFIQFTDAVLDTGLDCLPLAVGGCTRCKTCTYPDAPCRFPDRNFSSMEATGLLVNQVCVDNGVPYNYGRGKMAYTSCLLYND